MQRYTEYHAGVAVIKDKSRHKEAMAKLARLEDLESIPEIFCDQYCKYPDVFPDQEVLDGICSKCKLAKLFDLLT